MANLPPRPRNAAVLRRQVLHADAAEAVLGGMVDATVGKMTGEILSQIYLFIPAHDVGGFF